MATKTLDELKDALYEAFDAAVKYGHEDFGFDNNASHHAAAQSLTAAATIAQAIATIEKVQLSAQETKTRFSLDGK